MRGGDLDGFDVIAEISAGGDVRPWEDAGASWVLTGFGAQPREADVREAIDRGPGRLRAPRTLMPDGGLPLLMIPRLRLLVRVDNESATPEDKTVVARAVGRPRQTQSREVGCETGRASSRFAARLRPVQTERAAPGAALRDRHTLPRKPAFEVRPRGSTGRGLVSSTKLHGSYAIRLCVMNHTSGPEDVEGALPWFAQAPQPSQYATASLPAHEDPAADIRGGWAT